MIVDEVLDVKGLRSTTSVFRGTQLQSVGVPAMVLKCWRLHNESTKGHMSQCAIHADSRQNYTLY